MHPGSDKLAPSEDPSKIFTEIKEESCIDRSKDSYFIEQELFIYDQAKRILGNPNRPKQNRSSSMSLEIFDMISHNSCQPFSTCHVTPFPIHT